MSIFDRLESEVRGYCRAFPVVFKQARNATLMTEDGESYTDFFAGAGTLNYGHNNPHLKQALLRYIEQDGIIHGLDMFTDAKRTFLERLSTHVLARLAEPFKVQFTGPTGTNAVEAALKLARKVTGRTGIVSFTNGFHGVTLGSVATTGNAHFRNAAGVPLNNVSFMPYDGYLGPDADTLAYFRAYLEDTSSGLDHPAAVIVEPVQGEGGINVAGTAWLQGLRDLCDEFNMLMIADDIQVGCGRTGAFFSFERAGITPDLVTLSKSLSGSGLPMALLLIRAGLDQWKPGEHNGTFRGNNLAFVTAAAALETYWADERFSNETLEKGRLIDEGLRRVAEEFPDLDMQVRGRGMVRGLACRTAPQLAGAISKAAFERGLVIETSGTGDHVLKVLPPLTIETEQLEEGLEIIGQACRAAVAEEAAAGRLELLEVSA